jgi:Uma2 family endonuclease
MQLEALTDARWTSADLAQFPDNGYRYEIIEGELFVAKQPNWHHQFTCTRISTFLEMWSIQSGMGQTTQAPGLLFADDDDVAPDIVWISHERRQTALGEDGKLHAAPELVVEVLSPGKANQERDRKHKLNLYSRRGVKEYWIVDWLTRQVELYRRKRRQLYLMETLFQGDQLQSPLLPGFCCAVRDLFDQIPDSFQTKASAKKTTKNGSSKP